MSSPLQHYQPQHRPSITPRGVDLAPVANSITSTILHCRDGLAKAANGHTIAPSNPKAAQYRKQMAGGISDPVLQLATIGVTDLDDGVSFHVATAGLTRLLTFLKIHAEALQRRAPRSLTASFDLEFDQECRTNKKQHRAIRPNASQQELTEAIHETRKHIAALEQFATACEAELAQRQTSRTYAITRLAGGVTR